MEFQNQKTSILSDSDYPLWLGLEAESRLNSQHFFPSSETTEINSQITSRYQWIYWLTLSSIFFISLVGFSIGASQIAAGVKQLTHDSGHSLISINP